MQICNVLQETLSHVRKQPAVEYVSFTQLSGVGCPICRGQILLQKKRVAFRCRGQNESKTYTFQTCLHQNLHLCNGMAHRKMAHKSVGIAVFSTKNFKRGMDDRGTGSCLYQICSIEQYATPLLRPVLRRPCGCPRSPRYRV